MTTLLRGGNKGQFKSRKRFLVQPQSNILKLNTRDKKKIIKMIKLSALFTIRVGYKSTKNIL